MSFHALRSGDSRSGAFSATATIKPRCLEVDGSGRPNLVNSSYESTRAAATRIGAWPLPALSSTGYNARRHESGVSPDRRSSACLWAKLIVVVTCGESHESRHGQQEDCCSHFL